jgi:hypothetical protein
MVDEYSHVAVQLYTTIRVFENYFFLCGLHLRWHVLDDP